MAANAGVAASVRDGGTPGRGRPDRRSRRDGREAGGHWEVVGGVGASVLDGAGTGGSSFGGERRICCGSSPEYPDPAEQTTLFRYRVIAEALSEQLTPAAGGSSCASWPRIPTNSPTVAARSSIASLWTAGFTATASSGSGCGVQKVGSPRSGLNHCEPATPRRSASYCRFRLARPRLSPARRVRPSAQVGWAGQTPEAEEGRQSWAVWIATPRCLGDQQAGQFGGLQASPHHRRNHRQLHRGAVRSPVRCPAQAGRIDPGQCAELPHCGLPLPNEAGRRQHLVFRCVPRAPLQREERRTVRSKHNGLRESDPVHRLQDAAERKRHSRSDDS